MDIIFFALELVRLADARRLLKRRGRFGTGGLGALDKLGAAASAVNGVLIGYNGAHSRSLGSLSRSRLTCGERSSRSIRSASSKRRSRQKRMSGANLRFTR